MHFALCADAHTSLSTGPAEGLSSWWPINRLILTIWLIRELRLSALTGGKSKNVTLSLKRRISFSHHFPTNSCVCVVLPSGCAYPMEINGRNMTAHTCTRQLCKGQTNGNSSCEQYACQQSDFSSSAIQVKRVSSFY